MPHLHYTQLSENERAVIENRIKNGDSIRKIAWSINRNPSTVSRELRRNGRPPDCKTTRVNKPRADGRTMRGRDNTSLQKAKMSYKKRKTYFAVHSVYRYSASRATYRARMRKKRSMQASHPPLLSLPKNQPLLSYIEEKLALRWSPEQIWLRLKLEDNLTPVSFTTIYAYVYAHPELVKHLRRRGKQRRHYRQRTIYNQTKRLGHSIHDRPEIVQELSRLGDLEGDTIVGSDQKDRIVTHVDRVSGVLSMGLVLGQNAGKISEQTARDVARVFGRAHTITYDNGPEFSLWPYTERKTGSSIYFADPYTPSQRGRNENANGLIRDFLPKGTDFKELTEADILRIESLLNNRPRKRFGGRTPLEVSVALSP